MHHPTNRIAHTTAFVTPVVEHWLEREVAQWVHHEGSNALTAELHLALIDKGMHHTIVLYWDNKTVVGRWLSK